MEEPQLKAPGVLGSVCVYGFAVLPLLKDKASREQIMSHSVTSPAPATVPDAEEITRRELTEGRKRGMILSQITIYSNTPMSQFKAPLSLYISNNKS